MITVNNVSLDFSGQKLFSDVNLLFNAGRVLRRYRRKRRR